VESDVDLDAKIASTWTCVKGRSRGIGAADLRACGASFWGYSFGPVVCRRRGGSPMFEDDRSARRLGQLCSMRVERALDAVLIRLQGEFDLGCVERFQEESTAHSNPGQPSWSWICGDSRLSTRPASRHCSRSTPGRTRMASTTRCSAEMVGEAHAQRDRARRFAAGDKRLRCSAPFRRANLAQTCATCADVELTEADRRSIT
jgi:hypothetical protein